MTRTSAELKIVPCNYIMSTKLVKTILKESNLCGIILKWHELYY